MLQILQRATGDLAEPKGFRHELKYLGTDNELMLLKLRMTGILKPDSHTRPDGTYLIRSIYLSLIHI